jgi:hypothetical protein
MFYPTSLTAHMLLYLFFLFVFILVFYKLRVFTNGNVHIWNLPIFFSGNTSLEACLGEAFVVLESGWHNGLCVSHIKY